MKANNSVLVIGGGIAGIQASLDLAGRGMKVYLVEKSPSIGGRMAQLDKTFPTMDCSMCILAPKMIECSHHPNVKLLSYSEIKDVKGSVGNFKVKVLSVRTSTVTGKVKRMGKGWGRRPDWKRAIVTLKEGSRVEFFAGV